MSYVKETLEKYDEAIKFWGILPSELHKPVSSASRVEMLSHIRWMISTFDSSWHPIRKMTFLGFIQGVLWSNKIITREQIAEKKGDHNSRKIKTTGKLAKREQWTKL